MTLLQKTRLNSQGFGLQTLLPVLVIGIAGFVGAKVILASHAATPLPTTPIDVTAVAMSGRQIDLTWQASTDPGGPGVVGYRIIKNGKTIDKTVKATGYDDTTVMPATNYTYNIQAYDSSTPTNLSLPSVIVTVITPSQ